MNAPSEIHYKMRLYPFLIRRREIQSPSVQKLCMGEENGHRIIEVVFLLGIRWLKF